MRASFPPADLARLLRQIELSPWIDRVRSLDDGRAAATPDICAAVLEGADRFAREVLSPLNDVMDAQGCRLVDDRVLTAPGHREAWASFVDAGWPTLDAPPDHGGQGLPTIVALSAQEVFDRACPAFGMLPVPQRSALRLIAAHGNPSVKEAWLGPLAAGAWGATICVSEPDAGSDLPRIRCRAVEVDGTWRVSGEKCWISYGDQDLTEQVGHVVLARTVDADGGDRPSLFLVPAILPDGTRNSVRVRRIEEKLGLHGSPTAALGFEEASGHLLGAPGRGLAQMFVMIANMRMAVGAMGLGIASACADLALGYAEERRQGGKPNPVPIAEHADVRLMLLDITADADLLRGLLFAAANANDLAVNGDEEAASLVGWLLPIVKTLGGEVGFRNASTAIQTMGGAGYTREWPVEQALRDARVLTVFEGTTGIQALDLVHRRLLSGHGLTAFLHAARRDPDPRAEACLGHLDMAGRWLKANAGAVDAGATAFLRLASLAALSWLAARYCSIDGDDRTSRHLRAIGNHFLDGAEAKARMLAMCIVNGFERADRFPDIRLQSIGTDT